MRSDDATLYGTITLAAIGIIIGISVIVFEEPPSTVTAEAKSSSAIHKLQGESATAVPITKAIPTEPIGGLDTKRTENTIAPVESLPAVDQLDNNGVTAFSVPPNARSIFPLLFTSIKKTENVYCDDSGAFIVVSEIGGRFYAMNGHATVLANNGLHVRKDSKWLKVFEVDLAESDPISPSAVQININLAGLVCKKVDGIDRAFDLKKSARRHAQEQGAQYGLPNSMLGLVLPE